MNDQPLKGVSTINFSASDLVKEVNWYSAFLGFKPYFKTNGYIEFRTGGYQQELGIVESKYLQSCKSRGWRYA